MVKARRYLPEDYKQVALWLEERGVPVPRGTRFSSTGVIVDGMAVGFLYVTNSEIAILDSFITNPRADKLERSKALDEISQALIRMAQRYGARVVKCDSHLEIMMDKARFHGFKESGTYSSFLREI